MSEAKFLAGRPIFLQADAHSCACEGAGWRGPFAAGPAHLRQSRGRAPHDRCNHIRPISNATDAAMSHHASLAGCHSQCFISFRSQPLHCLNHAVDLTGEDCDGQRADVHQTVGGGWRKEILPLRSSADPPRPPPSLPLCSFSCLHMLPFSLFLPSG